jgi:hypothetical protein
LQLEVEEGHIEARSVKNTQAVELPPLGEPLSEGQGWVTIKDDFLLVSTKRCYHKHYLSTDCFRF